MNPQSRKTQGAKNAKTPQTEKLLEHLKEKGKDKSWSALTKLYNPSKNELWSRDIARIHGFDTATNSFTVQYKVEQTIHKTQTQKHRQESEHLVKRIIELERDLALMQNIKDYDPVIYDIPAPKKNNTHEATAIYQWSDWHVDELVDPDTVNGMNAYNKEIARKRAFKLFENSIKLTDTQRSGVKIDNAVLHLGGDGIGGYIHPELMQTNTMSPLEGIFYCKDLMASGIEYFLQHGKFKKITIVTSRGNHPRLTPKMQFANDYSMNLEIFLYYSLMEHFKHEKNIQFKVEKSELSYLNVYDRVLRFFHGHQVKFKGGVGGLTVPLFKQLLRWDQNMPAYYNFMCDKHCYSIPTPNCQLNGALKGFDAFAVSHGFSYQPPLQSFTLLDSKRGITVKAPIFCE